MRDRFCLSSRLAIATMLIAFASMGGCRTLTSPAKSKRLASGANGDLYLIDYEATRRATYVVRDKDGNVRIAAEPPPDVAFDSTAKLVASLSDAITKSADLTLEPEVIEKIVNLTERTQAVVIMRDAMFRLAEMHLNGAIEKDDYYALYVQSLAGALITAARDDGDAVPLIIGSYVDAANTERMLRLTDKLQALVKAKPSNERTTEDIEIAIRAVSNRLSQLASEPSAGSSIISSVLSDHPTVPLRQVDEGTIIRLAIRNEDATRATNNFASDWSGTKKFRVVVRGVPDELRKTMSFQLKRDVKWGSDPDIGQPFSDGATIEISGDRLYLAERGFDAGAVLRTAPNAVVLLIEEGTDPNRVE